jgi:hypothetical protein
MKKLHFEVVINAPRERVWDNVVNDEPYRKWAGIFMPGSYFEGSWEKGARIRFLALSAAGEPEGMFSEIAESRRPEFLSIRHLGMVRNGKEDRESEEAKKWQMGYENYTLSDVEGGTRFDVDLDVPDDSMAQMFSDVWPKALAILKEISEK